jgi:hypothetical protein
MAQDPGPTFVLWRYTEQSFLPSQESFSADSEGLVLKSPIYRAQRLGLSGLGSRGERSSEERIPSTQHKPRFPIAVIVRLPAMSIMAGLILLSLVLTHDANAQNVVSASPDITIDLGASLIVSDEDVAVDNQLGIVVLENIGALPVESEVVALGLDVNGDRLISFDTTTSLAGGIVARPGDVIRYDGATYSIEFDASAAGLPAGVATDATSLSRNGLLLSFDTTVDLGGGLVVADEDLVDWDGSTFGLLFDGTAAGVDAALDVDGAQDIGGGRFLISFDTTGEIAGLVFDDEDIVRYDGVTWTLEFDASAANANWAAADMDAVMVPEPGILGLLGAGCSLLFAFDRRRKRT